MTGALWAIISLLALVFLEQGIERWKILGSIQKDLSEIKVMLARLDERIKVLEKT